jgi:hypothetical protein
VTFTVTLSLLLLPPSPLQVSVNVLVLVSGPTLRVPEVPLLPDQAPAAAQLSALVLDQVRLTLSPSSMPVLEAFNETVGAAGSVTCTVTLSLRVPPGPLQVSVKVLVEARLPVDVLPSSARLPVQAPAAVQLVALVLDQLRFVAAPRRTLLTALVSATVGAGCGCTTRIVWLAVAWPPGPVQFSTKVTSEFNGPTVRLPFTDREPLQAPPALQVEALLVFQLSCTESPASTVF